MHDTVFPLALVILLIGCTGPAVEPYAFSGSFDQAGDRAERDDLGNQSRATGGSMYLYAVDQQRLRVTVVTPTLDSCLSVRGWAIAQTSITEVSDCYRYKG